MEAACTDLSSQAMEKLMRAAATAMKKNDWELGQVVSDGLRSAPAIFAARFKEDIKVSSHSHLLFLFLFTGLIFFRCFMTGGTSVKDGPRLRAKFSK